MNNKDTYCEKSEVKSILSIAIPLVIAQIFQVSLGAVDSIMVGHLDSNNLAAVAMGTSLLQPITFFFFGILFSLSPITAHLYGAKKNVEVGEEIRQGFWVVLIISIIAVALVLKVDKLCYFLDVDKSVIPLIKGYLEAVSYGIPGMFIFIALKSFFEGIGQVKSILIVSLIGALSNVVFNYALVYGHFGFPKLGAIGTGYATATVYWMMGLVMLLLSLKSKKIEAFKVFSKFSYPDSSKLKSIFKIGLPIGVGISVEIAIFAIVALLAGRFGVDIIGGNQIALNLCGITYMIPLGLAMSATTLIGQSVGAGNFDRAMNLGKLHLKITVLCMFVLSVLMFLLRDFIGYIYTTDTNVIAIASHLLIFASIFQLFDGMQVCGLGCLRGIKDTKTPMLLNVFSYWIVGLPISYFFGITLNMKVEGLWYGLIIGLLLSAITQNIRYFSKMKRKLDSLGKVNYRHN